MYIVVRFFIMKNSIIKLVDENKHDLMFILIGFGFLLLVPEELEITEKISDLSGYNDNIFSYFAYWLLFYWPAIVAGIVLVFGFFRIAKQLIKNHRKKYIYVHGVKASAYILDLKKNLNKLIKNKQGFYRIRYMYTDNYGQKHYGNDDLVPNQFVEGKNLKIGHTIEVKYLPEKHSKSILILK